ncbi:hypothetical protein, partial [Massilia sp. UBA6681]|uniref:hypothetical protein n=1 Tax=Massilia sp. UBA6681 TaxID=1946839 RepID=UPI0025C094C3
PPRAASAAPAEAQAGGAASPPASLCNMPFVGGMQTNDACEQLFANVICIFCPLLKFSCAPFLLILASVQRGAAQ